KLCECLLKRTSGLQSNSCQQRVREFATDDCANLGDFLGSAEPVKTGRERIEQGYWHGECVQGTNGDIAVTDILDQLGFQHGLGKFLDEQRNPVRLANDLLGQLWG